MQVNDVLPQMAAAASAAAGRERWFSSTAAVRTARGGLLYDAVEDSA
jgi:hypothetical protein